MLLSRLHITIALLALTSGIATAATFATMSVDEVSALLALQESRKPSDSAKETVADCVSPQPVNLTATDMVTKVYGVISPDASRNECKRLASTLLCLTPEEDGDGLWLESANGYVVNYYGMEPEVSALATYRRDHPDEGASDYGFFFIFPYSASDRDMSVRSQADFCGALLQEMSDSGLDLSVNAATDDLFDVVGDYQGGLVNVRLLDDPGIAGDGRFILILSVQPDAFSPADDFVADNII